jgi:hypothetical protein
MPVAGPNKQYAYDFGKSLFSEILEHLKSKHNITRPHEFLPLGKKFAEEWDEKEKELLKIIQEMVWIDHASSW